MPSASSSSGKSTRSTAAAGVRIVDSFAATDVGLRRGRNEDAVITDPERGIFLLADGMGGHPGGEIASSIAISECHKALVKALASGSSPKSALSTAFKNADIAVKAYGYEHPKYANMGSTMVVSIVRGSTAWIAHCGDSRAYLYRGGLKQLTSDHGQNGYLAKAIGCVFGTGPDIVMVPIQRGDLLLLCSDGLSSVVDHDVIEQEMKTAKGCAKAAKKLIDQALDVGAPDNVTVICVRVG